MESSIATLEPRADESSASPVHPEEQPSWTARPVVAGVLRGLIFLAPIAASVLASFLVARRWPRPDALVPTLGWLGVLIVVGGIAMVAIDRVARRFLPLAALLRMTLIFPDQAPSRFGVAIRSGTTKQLERRLDHVQEHGLGATETEAAETLLELAAALREHDRFTRGHGERVRAYAALIGEELGLDALEISKLQWAGLIHDIGKLAVPEEVLNKPGRLTPEEYDLIKTHPAEGMAMMGPLTGWLGEWALAVGEHHERWDGTGYPARMAGPAISLAGRIVAVADTFDVITATRSYKPSQSPQWARRELAANAGTQFDPDVVRAFLNVSLGKLRGVMWPLSWIAHIPFLGSTVTAPATGLAAATVAVVGSAVTGGSLGSDLPPEIDPIERAPVHSVVDEVDEVEGASPTTTTLVIPPPSPRVDVTGAAAGAFDEPNEEPNREPNLEPNDEPGPGGATPLVIVVTTTTSPDVAGTGVPVIVTIPAATTTVPASGDTGPGAAPTTIAGTPPPSPATPTTLPAVGGVPDTLPDATRPATTLPATTLAPTTTVAPTTTLVGTTCADARSGATNLAGADLAGCDLSGLTLTGLDLSGADLSGADLAGVRLSFFDLDGADLTDATFDDAVLIGGTMRVADGTGLSAENVRIEGVDLSGSDLTDAELDDGVFTAVSFAGTRFRGADFSAGEFTAVSFANAELHEASFDQSVMVGAEMSGVIAREASFEDVDARGSNWTNADLRNADFSDSKLSDGNVTNADVRNADFGSTDFRDTTGIPDRASSARYSDTVCPDGTVQSSNCWP